MIFCPNKNSKEFQELVGLVGENQAYFLWNKYKGEVPIKQYNKNNYSDNNSIPENVVPISFDVEKNYISKDIISSKVIEQSSDHWIYQKRQRNKFNTENFNESHEGQWYYTKQDFKTDTKTEISRDEYINSFKDFYFHGQIEKYSSLAEQDSELLAKGEYKLLGPKFITEDKAEVSKNFITYSQALEKARELLPDFKEEDLAFITKEAMFSETGRKDVMGMYRKGSIFIIDKNGKGTIEEYILRHELFHKIFTEYLTKDEQEKLKAAFGKEFPEDTMLDFEETLATKFQAWKNNKLNIKHGTLRKLFNKILRFLGLLKANTKSIDLFFQQIENQTFTVKKQDVTEHQKYISELTKKFGNTNETYIDGVKSDHLQNYLKLRDTFVKDYNGYFEKGIRFDSKNDYIVTGQNEIKVLIKNNLNNKIDTYTKQLIDLQAKLEKDPENEALLLEKRNITSDKRFAMLYSKHYDFLYKQIFPNSLNSKQVAVIDYLEEESYDEETGLETTDLPKGQGFSFQSEVYDSTNKTSTKVKSILSNIFDEQRDDYLTWEEAYKVSLELLNDLPANDLGVWYSMLQKKVNTFNKSSYAAVINKIFEIKNKALSPVYKDKTTNRAMPRNAKFLSLDNKEHFLLVFDPEYNTSKIERVIDIPLYLKEGEYILIKKAETHTTKAFIYDILDKLEDIEDHNVDDFLDNIALLNSLRIKQYYTQALRELLQNLISQKENNRVMATITTNEKGTEYRYFSALQESIEQSVNSDIISKISSKLETSEKVNEFVKTYKHLFYDANGKYFKGDDQKLKASKAILDALGFSNYNYQGIFKYGSTDGLYDALRYFLFGHTKDSAISKVGKNEYFGDFIVQSTIQSVLDKEGSFVRQLSKFLRFNLEADRPGMSKTIDGKMVYNYTPSSNGMDIYRRLSQNNFLIANKFEEYPYEEGFQYLQTEYFKLNPFNPFIENPSNKRFIYDVYIDGGSKITSTFGNNESIMVYTKEDLSAFINRTFNLGFLTTLNSSTKDLRYIQFSSPVSNRPNIPGVLTDVLSDTQIDSMIELILRQIVARPDIQNVHNYDRHKLINLDRIANVLKQYKDIHKLVEIKKGVFEDRYYLTEKHLKDKSFLDTVKQSFKKQIRQDAENLFKQVVENQITFSSTFNKNGLVKAYEMLSSSTRRFATDDNAKANMEAIEKKLKNSKYFETWMEVKKRYALIEDIKYADERELNNKVSFANLKEKGYQKEYKVNADLKDAILPLFEVYLQNDYINSYFLDQLNMGGTEFFKSSVDRVKRRQGAYSPGLKGLVNDQIGMSRSFYTAVIEDPTRKLDDELSEDESVNEKNYLYELLVSTKVINKEDSLVDRMKVYHNFVNKFDKFNPSDAQGYMLPERASELQKGFGESYQIGNVLKPAHYEIDALGVPRMVKYSAIVLTDELVTQFPQLSAIRNKMRNAKDSQGNSRPVGEIVYHTAFKVGAPKNRLGMKNGKFSEEEFNKLFEENDYELHPDSVVELANERYKLQLNPEHDLDSIVAKPTQLFYFLKILNTNIGEATSVYNNLSKIMDIDLNDFKSKYLNTDNTFKIKEFTDYLIKKGANSETEVYHEILAELYNKVLVDKGENIKPWNFPGIEDKIITQFSSTLQNDIVQTKFKGTKLVLMSQVGANLNGRAPLKYKEDENGNMYAEVYMPKGLLNAELEKEIQVKGFAHLFHLPELFGFRIPSSEIHSAVPMRIVGFHDLGSNVVIAPEEIVPLHGSDFDVDALFVIVPEMYSDKEPVGIANTPIGYIKKDGYYILQDEDSFRESIKEYNEEKQLRLLKSYYKNNISNTITKVTADRQNRLRMINPISMKDLQQSIADLFDTIKGNPNLDPSGQIDESSAIDKQKVHSSSMNGRDGTGIFANFAKGMAYILHTSSNKENPLLLKQEENLPYFTSQLPLNTLYDKVSVWENLDSLLNAAIDNVKEQALPKLNLNGTTIPTYAMMLGLGVKFEIANLIMVQPIIKHLSGISGKEKDTSKGVISAINLLRKTLKNISLDSLNEADRILVNNFLNPKTTQLEENNLTISEEDLRYAVSIEIINSPNTTISDITDIKALLVQLKVLENYRRTESIVNNFNKIVRYLSIVRDMPVFSNKIYELLDLKNQIWNEDGTTVKNFPINVDDFFESNPHIAKSDEILQLQLDLLKQNFFKHNEKLQDFFKNLEYLRFDVNQFTDLKIKQDEFIKFMYSSLYFTKKNNDIQPFNYKLNNFKFNKQLLDQEAFVQHFVNKIRVLKEIMPNNYFIKRFSILDLGYSQDLKKLAFYLDNKVTPLNKAQYEKAFAELSQYNIFTVTKEEHDAIKDEKLKYNSGENYYRVVRRDLQNEKSRESDLQKEFVQYNILTEGMRNSSSSYSQLLPGYIYRDQYYSYENLMKKILSDNNFSLEEFSNLFHIYSANITLNNANKMSDFRQPYTFKTPDEYSVQQHDKDLIFNSGQKLYYDIVTETSTNTEDFIQIKFPIYKSKFKSQGEFEESVENDDALIEAVENGFEEEKKEPDYYQTRLYKRVYEANGKSYYHFVSLVKNNKVYKSNSDIFNNPKEATYDRFSPNYYHIKYSSIKDNKIILANETNANFLLNHLKDNLPEFVSTSAINDNLRLDTKFIRIKNINLDTREIEFEELPTKPPVKLINEIVGVKSGIVSIKSDETNTSAILFTKTIQSLEEILKQYREFADPKHYVLFEMIQPYIELKNTSVVFNHKFRSDRTLGLWKRENGVTKIYLSQKLKTKSDLSATFLHELLHHVVYDMLHKNENLLSSDQKVAKRRLEGLFNAAKKEGKLDGKNSQNTYGLTDLDEFISEAFSNKEFQEWLSSKIINKKSLWTRFKEVIANILGISEDTMLFDVINSTMALISEDSGISDLNDINTDVEKESQEAFFTKRKIYEPFSEIRFAGESINLQVGKDATGQETDFYTSNIGNFDRSTDDSKGFQTWYVPGYNFKKYQQGSIEYDADVKYKDIPENQTQFLLNKNLTKKEYIQERKKVREEALLRGKMTEALFNYYLTLDPAKYDEVKEYMEKLPLEIRNKILILDDLSVIKKILFTKMSTNIANGDGSKIDFSIPTFSKALNRAGTIDTMIKHPDGEYSLFDIKTSQFYSESEFTKMFAYGQTFNTNIVANDRNKAKLQIMFYALMVRLNNPKVKFKRLGILHLPVTSSKTKFLDLLENTTLAEDTVETASYLEMIQSFLKDKKQQIELGLIKEGEKSLYEKLEEEYKSNGGKSIEDLFEPTKYFNYYTPNDNVSSSVATNGNNATNKTREQQILQELAILLGSEKDSFKIMNPKKDKITISRFGEEIEVDTFEATRKKRIVQLIEEWVRLTGDTKLEYLSTQDIDFLHLNFASNKDMDSNPIFGTWNKFKYSRQSLARATASDKISILKLRTSKALPNVGPISLKTQRELFGKFIKKEYNGVVGREVERLVHKKYNDVEYNNLNQDEKAFVDYLNDTFEAYFAKGSYLHNTASVYIDQFGKQNPISHLEAYNKGKDKFEYYPGWFPKTPITPEEYREKVLAEKGATEGGKKLLENWFDRQFTQYFENLFNINEDTAAIPLKYLGNSEIEEKQLYSIKLDQVFEKFVQAMEHKIHLDDVYNTGRSLQMLLSQENTLTGAATYFDVEQNEVKQRFANLIENIRERIEFEIKDNPIQKTKWLNKEFIIGNKKVDTDKSLLLLSQAATASVMWLKPIQGAGNFAMGVVVKYKEALKFSIGKRILKDFDSKQMEFGVSDVAWGEKEYAKLITDSTSEEKLYSNKLFLIAEKFGYLADNYRFGSNSRKFKSDTNKIFTQDNMYIFHTLGEHYLSYTTLAAQLNHYTINVNGKDVPIYELYDVEPIEAGSKYSKLVWKGPKRTIKDGNTLKEVDGITDDEMYRFKAVSARMQGDYRREEHIRLEHYALGKITVVLKKFFSRLIFNGLIGKTESRALGYYKETEITNEDGTRSTVLEWNMRNIEGKWRTLGNAILAILRIKGDISLAGGFTEYWSKLNQEQKLNLIDALTTALITISAYGSYVLMFSDTDDDDTLKKAWKTYLIDNTSQQYNIIDLLRTGTTIAQPVLVKKAFDLASAGTQLFLLNGMSYATGNSEDAWTEDGNLRGLNQFLKSIPYTAFGQDFYNKINKINADQYNLFGFNEDKLRN